MNSLPPRRRRKAFCAHTIAKGVSRECHGAGVTCTAPVVPACRPTANAAATSVVYNREDAKANPKACSRPPLQELLPGLRYRRFAVAPHEALSEGHSRTTCHDPHGYVLNGLDQPVHGSEPEEELPGLPHHGRSLLLAGRYAQPQQSRIPHMPVVMGSCENFAAIQRSWTWPVIS